MSRRGRNRRGVSLGLLSLLLLPAVVRAAPCNSTFALDHKQPLLQTALQRELRAAGYSPALERRELAVALVDLTRPEDPAYAGLNDDVMLYAASLPKIGILLGVAQAAQRGDVEWQPHFSHRLRKMITVSDNEYASWAAELLGLRYLADVLRDSRYCLYDGDSGGLWVGRSFRKDGPSLRDPLHGISHGATARQAARFYVLLDREKLVSPHFSRRMASLMAPPEYSHKFVRALADLRGVEFLARKSGTWGDFHSDSALVRHGSRRYVVVGLAHHRHGEAMMRRIALVADDLIARGEHRGSFASGLR